MVRGDCESSSGGLRPRSGPPQELSLFDHIHIIYRYRWVILPVCIVAAGVVGGLSYLSEPRFEAKVSLVPPVQASGDSGLGMLSGVGASLLRKVVDSANAADLYVGILASQTVGEAIVDRFDLVKVYDKGLSRDRTKRWLQKNTEIKVSKEGILTVAVEDADPNRAAAIANAYVEELDLQNKRFSLGRISNKRVFLESRLKEVEQKLSRIDNLPTREAQIQEMLYELFMRELELAKIEEAKSMPTIQVLDPAVPPEIRKPRGTVTKAALAGVVAFVCMVFVGFIREYYVECGHGGRSCDSLDWDRRKSDTDPKNGELGRSPPLTANPG